MRIFGSTLATLLISSFAWFITPSFADVLDLVVITARKTSPDAVLCDGEGNCIYPGGPERPPGTDPGTGVVAAVDLGALKNMISAIELPCKPAGMSDADYIKGAVAMCVAKATAAYSAAFGVTIGGFSMIITQSQCNVKVQESVATGSAACK